MELFALVGVAAVVITVLKGRVWAAAAVVAAAAGLVALVAVRGDVSAGDVSTTTLVLVTVGVPAWALAAVVVAARPATTDSQWMRRGMVDTSGRPLVASQPVGRRIRRSVLGAAVGAAPAVALMTVVIAAADTGDEAQLAFVGIPLGAFGIVVGALVGYHWVPRSALGAGAGPRRTSASVVPTRPEGRPSGTAGRVGRCAGSDPRSTRPRPTRPGRRATRRERPSPAPAGARRSRGRPPGGRCRSRPGREPGRRAGPPPANPGE